MKNKIILVFLFPLILISFNRVQAYGNIYPGGILNPLQVKIVPQPGDKLDALIQQQNQDRILQQQVLNNQLLQQQINLQKNQLLQQQINSQPIIKSNNQIIPSVTKGSSGGGGGGGSAPKIYTKTITPVVAKDVQREVVTENPSNEIKLDPVVVEKVKNKSFWSRIVGWFGF